MIVGRFLAELEAGSPAGIDLLLKANRMVSLSAEDGYSHLDAIDWNDERLRHGIIVKLKKVPFKVSKVVALNGDIDWVITNDLDETVITQVAQNANECAGRSEFHRQLKQQAPNTQSSYALAVTMLGLKVHAALLIYRHTDLFSDYPKPTSHIPACQLRKVLTWCWVT